MKTEDESACGVSGTALVNDTVQACGETERRKRE